MRNQRMRLKEKTSLASLLILLCLLWMSGVASGVERLRFKPGFNLFSAQQDIQMGHENAAQVEKELPMLRDPEAERYVNELGRRLSQYTPNNRSEYVWQLKVVNSKDINAFALPGGFIYVNRATIEAAQDEAQLAGVIAHEEGHVVMRHGTHQVSQVILAQAPLAILGSFLGQSGTLASQLAQYGIGLGVQSIFLHNSRSMESQADEVGTYVLYQAGYDPHAMAQFFQIIEQKYPQRTIQFFSDHPNPENRIKNVDAEIAELGPAKQWKTNSPEFRAAKQRLLGMPEPPKAKPAPRSRSSLASPPPAPSDRFVRYQGDAFAIDYPDNWQVQKGDNSMTMAPQGGILEGAQGEPAQAYGVSITQVQPPTGTREGWGLGDATSQFVESMRQSNPNLRVIKQNGFNVSGRPALSTLLENDSPIEGQKEQDRLVTMRLDAGLFAIIFIVPQNSAEAYHSTFMAMMQSIELR